MSQYKSGKIGLRWRAEREVMSGKGQFICGNKHCDERNTLSSYEVNFCYWEAGEKKQALVKLVNCERCGRKLLYKKNKEKDISCNSRIKREREEEKQKGPTSLENEKRKKRKEGCEKDDEEFEEFLEGMLPPLACL